MGDNSVTPASNARENVMEKTKDERDTDSLAATAV